MGLTNGVIVVYKRESTLSVASEWLVFVCKCLMIAVTKNKLTTVRWEEHVEKALDLPVAEGNFKIVVMILI